MTTLEPIGDIVEEPRRGRRRQVSPDDVPLTEREELILELVHVGIGLRKAENLVNRFPPEKIWQQIRWLPLRSPRRPASLLITAIEHGYEPPAYANGK